MVGGSEYEGSDGGDLWPLQLLQRIINAHSLLVACGRNSACVSKAAKPTPMLTGISAQAEGALTHHTRPNDMPSSPSKGDGPVQHNLTTLLN
jgi:hypothetical protein